MTGQLEGKVAFVTGGAGGMGRATVLAFAREGARVVLADIDEERGRETVELATGAGGPVQMVRTDVSRDADVAAAVAAAVTSYGGLDCAVNAAAIEFEGAPIADCEEADWDRMIAVNLKSVFLSMKHELRAMLAHGRGGSIVNIASTSSIRPQPATPGYTSSKHGVLGLTRSGALDYAARGIRINAICPGAIDTPMLRGAMARRGRDEATTVSRLVPLGRLGQPDDIADAVLWLCSDASAFVSGHALAVDGGYLAGP